MRGLCAPLCPQAVADFLARIAKYEEVYQPIDNRNLHYIKLIGEATRFGEINWLRKGRGRVGGGMGHMRCWQLSWCS